MYGPGINGRGALQGEGLKTSSSRMSSWVSGLDGVDITLPLTPSSPVGDHVQINMLLISCMIITFYLYMLLLPNNCP